MFLEWKNQYYENDYNTQSKLKIQCNPYKLPKAFFHRVRTNISHVVWKHTKNPNRESNLEVEWSWRNQAPWLQTILQSYNSQNSVYRPVE